MGTRFTPSRIGDKIGNRYKIIKILSGGMGLVYIVEDPSSIFGGRLALKTLREERTQDIVNGQRDRAASRKEFYTWISMGNHPNIVCAFFVDELDGRLYIVLEYVAPDERGWNTLKDYLKGPKLPTERIIALSIEFCLRMEHAVSCGIKCHRDIKPANIMIK